MPERSVDPLGLEPRKTEPESVVLPLHHGSMAEKVMFATPIKRHYKGSIRKRQSQAKRYKKVDPPGLEPGTTEPKSAVLPLHHGSEPFQSVQK